MKWLLLLLPITANAAMLITETWDAGIEQWYRSGASHTATNETVGRNGESLCYTVKVGENRTELVPRGDKNPGIDKFVLGNEYWYGFSVYVPRDAPDGNESIVWQIHGVPDVGELSRNPNLAIYYINGLWRLNVAYDADKITTRIKSSKHVIGIARKGAWTDFIVQSIWSYGDDGLVRVHLNGYGGLAERVTRNGGNAYNDDQGGYMKVGIYHLGGNTTNEIVFCNDEIRVYKGQWGNDSVAPRGFK